MHKNRMQKTIFLTSLIFSLLTGCSDFVTPTPAPPIETIASTASLMTTPILTLHPAPSPAPTATLASDIMRQCFEIKEQEVLFQDVATGGTVLVGDYPENPYLLDIKTGARYKLPFIRMQFEQGNGMSLSPDRQFLAYVEMLKDEAGVPAQEILRVVDSRGNLLAEEIFNRTDIYLNRWLDNQSLQLNLMNVMKYREDDTVTIFNPFTMKQHIISDPLPQINNNDFPVVSWRVQYSPSLKWVVYRGFTSDNSGTNSIIVWDIHAKETLWESPSSIEMPSWSPVGDEVAIAAGNQIYIVDDSGQANLVLDASADDVISHLAWSPDGKYLAFRAWPLSDSKGRLMVYNVQTKQTIDYCIASEFIDDTPVWSPDSRQLIIAIRNEVNNSLVDLSILVDFQNNIGYKVPVTMSPSIWMDSLP